MQWFSTKDVLPQCKNNSYHPFYVLFILDGETKVNLGMFGIGKCGSFYFEIAGDDKLYTVQDVSFWQPTSFRI